MNLMQTIFESGGFDGNTLTVAINDAPYVPGILARRGLFRDAPIDTTETTIELIDENLTLVPATPRGGVGEVHRPATRRAVRFKCPHLRTRQAIYADSFQDRRGFGEKALASVGKEKDRMLGEMRRRIEATIEYHRARALAGQILDADGSVLVDLLAEFDVAQNTHDLNLEAATTHAPNAIVAAKRKSEAELGAVTPSGWLAVCSAGFLDTLRAHPSVAQFAEGWAAASALRDDVRADFGVANVQFVEMRNAAGATFIEDGCAYLVPEGVPDLFLTHYAPADYIDTANSAGLPMYARAELGPMGRFISLEAQANPVSVVTRPRAVVKLTA